MLYLFVSSWLILGGLSATCDQCWDEYHSCDSNAWSTAWESCNSVWDENTEYSPFDRQCIEEQAQGQVQCYEDAGCFEAGNQECWWKLWDLGCSPYKCEAYTICSENHVADHNCDGQLTQCEETCDDQGFSGSDSSYDYYSDSYTSDSYHDDSYSYDDSTYPSYYYDTPSPSIYYDSGYDSGSYDSGSYYYYDSYQPYDNHQWEYSYDEIPQCIKDQCGEVLDQCASSGACQQGIENVANSCYQHYDDVSSCMDDTFISTESNSQSALDLCSGCTECANDLQALGECIINSADYGHCPETDYKALKSLVRLVKSRRVLKRREALRKSRAQRSRRQQLRPRPRSRARAPRGKLAQQQRARIQRRRRRLAALNQRRQRLQRRNQRQRARPRSQLRLKRKRGRRQLGGYGSSYNSHDSGSYYYGTPSPHYYSEWDTNSWDSGNYDTNSWDNSNWDTNWDTNWDSYNSYNSYDPYQGGETQCGGGGGEEDWEYTYDEVPPCITNNCDSELTTCAGDYICKIAIESIAKECESEIESEIGECIEGIVADETDESKVNEFCDSDNLCIESFTDLGQCVIDNGCFSGDNVPETVGSVVKSLQSLRRQKVDRLKGLKLRKQKAASESLKRKETLAKNKKLSELKQRLRAQQRREYLQKRREFNKRIRSRKSKL